MAKGLNYRPGGTARCDQMFGRGMAKVHDALSQHDAPRRAVGQISALCRDLGRKAEGVCCARSGDLDLRAGLPRKSVGDIVRRG